MNALIAFTDFVHVVFRGYLPPPPLSLFPARYVQDVCHVADRSNRSVAFGSGQLCPDTLQSAAVSSQSFNVLLQSLVTS